MRVAVATQQGGLSDQVSPMVGRAPTYTLVKLEDDQIKNSSVMRNQFAQSASGAGVQAAQMLVNEGIEVILGGNFGPNLANIFNRAGVEMYQVQGETVESAVNQYLQGELRKATDATAPVHGGMGTGGGGTMVGGMGGGRGMGMRQTMTQGRMNSSMQPRQGSPAYGTQIPDERGPQLSKKQQLQALDEQTKVLEQQLNQIKNRIEELSD